MITYREVVGVLPAGAAPPLEVTHTFERPGRFGVRVTLSADGNSLARSQVLTLACSPGPAPGMPFPDCGTAPEPESLGCRRLECER
jgi:hypothetical protein